MNRGQVGQQRSADIAAHPDVAVARLLEDDVPAEGKRTVRDPELMEDPAWMVDLADAGWGKVVLACRTIEKAEAAREQLVERTGRTRLVDVQAIEGGYPFYGAILTAPADRWTAL